MILPTWMTYLCIFGFSLIMVGAGLSLIVFIGGVLTDVLIPKLWYCWMRMRLKRMSHPDFTLYIEALIHEYESIHRKGGRKNDGRKESKPER